MNTKPTVCLHLFFATENDRAVILRQGPTKQFRMILWHRDTDTFDDGQWLKQNVYPERCDLSPDGQHFLYAAYDHREPGIGTFTAISRTPYFTALAVYPCGGFSGGGWFVDNRFCFATGNSARNEKRLDDVERLVKKDPTDACKTGWFRVDGRCAPFGQEKASRMRSNQKESQTAFLDLYDTQGGCLYRRRGQEQELIRDFNGMAFEPIRAPYDSRKEDERSEHKAWHPDDP